MLSIMIMTMISIMILKVPLVDVAESSSQNLTLRKLYSQPKKKLRRQELHVDSNWILGFRNITLIVKIYSNVYF